MSSSYTGNAANVTFANPVSITEPSDGDAASAASVNNPGPFQATADWIANLKQTLVTSQWSIALGKPTQGTCPNGLVDAIWSNWGNPAPLTVGWFYAALAPTAGASTAHWAGGADGTSLATFTSSASTFGIGLASTMVSGTGIVVGVTNTVGTLGGGSGTCGIETWPSTSAAPTVTARTIPSTVSAAVPAWGACVAVSSPVGGTFVAAVGNTGQVISSTDGITWTARGTTPMAGKIVTSVAYGNGFFLACATDGTAWSSPDGITWTAISGTTIGYATAGTRLSYSSKLGKFLANPANSDSYALGPAAGPFTTNLGPSQVFGAGYGNGLATAPAWNGLVAVGSYPTGSRGQLAFSVDGSTWNLLPQVNMPVPNGALKFATDRVYIGMNAAAAYASLPAALP